MLSLGYKRSRFFCDLFINEKTRLEVTLYRFYAPQRAAFEMLEATLVELLYHGKSVETLGDWLVAKIRNHRRRYWVGRRVRFGANLDEAFPGDRLPYAQRS